MRSSIVQISILLLLSFTLGNVFGFGYFSRFEPPKEESTELAAKIEEIKALLERGEALFIDARIEEHFEAAHIPTSLSIPYPDLQDGRPEILDYIPEEQPLIVYCDGGTCHASEDAAEILKEYGYQNVRTIPGGWEAWMKFGGPVEVSP